MNLQRKPDQNPITNGNNLYDCFQPLIRKGEVNGSPGNNFDDSRSYSQQLVTEGEEGIQLTNKSSKVKGTFETEGLLTARPRVTTEDDF